MGVTFVEEGKYPHKKHIQAHGDEVFSTEIDTVEGELVLSTTLNKFKALNPIEMAVDYAPTDDKDVATKEYVDESIEAVPATSVTTLAKTVITSTNVESALQEVNDRFVTETDLLDLGSVSGTVNVDMSVKTFFKVAITAATTFNITNVRLRTPICFLDITGAFTINIPTSSGVTFNLMTNSDTYTSGKSRLFIIFNSATQADYFFKNIE